MDPAEEAQLRAVVEHQGAMLNDQAEELSHARHTVDALVARVTELSDKLRYLQPVDLNVSSAAPQQATGHEPRINNPPIYAGEPTNCRSFLIQCEVVFSLQPQTYALDRSRVAYVISLLAGRARDWGTAIWDSRSLCCDDFKSFKAEMIKVFDRSVFGKEASRQLASLRQGKRSVADYSIEFKTLAATSEWNSAALVARFLDGLVADVKDEIYARDPPDLLDDIIDLAIRLDSRMELRRKVRGNTSWMRPEPSVSFSASRAPESSDLEPMQLGRMRLTAEEKQRRLLKGLCLYCGGHGHIAAGCPLKANAHQ